MSNDTIAQRKARAIEKLTNDRDTAIKRAEAAEARAAQAESHNANLMKEIEQWRIHVEHVEQERDEARLELQHIRTMLDDGSDCGDTALDMVKRLHAQHYEARRQLSEAQHAIDVLSNTVVAQDAEIKRLSQQREDVEQYRAEIERLNQAATA